MFSIKLLEFSQLDQGSLQNGVTYQLQKIIDPIGWADVPGKSVVYNPSLPSTNLNFENLEKGEYRFKAYRPGKQCAASYSDTISITEKFDGTITVGRVAYLCFDLISASELNLR